MSSSQGLFPLGTNSSYKVHQFLKGWIRTLRRQKHVAFAEVSNGNSSDVQAVLSPETAISGGIHTGSSVIFEGEFVASVGPKQAKEFKVNKIVHLGACPPKDYPIAKKFHTPEHLRSNPHLRMRTKQMQQVCQLRNNLLMQMHDFFQREGFLHINTPIITQNDCEGGSEAFEVGFFGKRAFLTVSGQLHLEAAAAAFEKVYTIGPCFRAEKHHTQRHLAEFWMIEAEIAFLHSLDELINHVKKCLKFVIEKSTDFIPSWLNCDWPVISYHEAVEICMEKKLDFYKAEILEAKHEKFLAEEHFQRPFFITQFPAQSKPFYTKKMENNQIALAFDLIFPEVGEICGGSLREDDLNSLRSQIPGDESKKLLEWYLELRKYGSVPHGGFGIGFERLVQLLSKAQNIRDAVPFPRAEGCFKC